MKKTWNLLLVAFVVFVAILGNSNSEAKAVPAPILKSAVIDQVSNDGGNWENIPYNAQPLYKANAVMHDYVYFRVTTDGYSNNYIYSGSTMITTYATNYKSIPIVGSDNIVTGYKRYYRVPVENLVTNSIQVYAYSQVGTTKIWTNIISFDVE
ncbi:DUF4879 domain-containing protein [Rummeliibacillus sp. SL167]|uniref:DUF4879 domain-containing protein n=1 Tax=Rummeliibacillus sp. SL167 TaxID=2579792 RepID=UPI0011B6D383|nr:DUF4879 domain-containing protein [Rummeliibacillus sp. SL167]